MRTTQLLTRDQGGVVLVTVILVLCAVTLLSMTLSYMSDNETYMTVNEKCKTAARYNCESCTTGTAKLVRMVFDADAPVPTGSGTNAPGIMLAPPESAATAEEEFYLKLMGGVQDAQCADVDFTPAGIDASADVRRDDPSAMAGTAANQYAAGYSYGIGLGGASGGGVVYWFQVACRGGGCYDARHVAYTRYRKVPVPGGM